MASSGPVILAIEDDPAIRKFLRVSLESQGYVLHEATKGQEGLAQASMHAPELVILDLGLPDMDGLDLIRQLREWSKVPILIISARGKEQDKVAALDTGADDYLTKPFSIGELLARLRAALRRRDMTAQNASALFRTGELTVDLARRRVSRGGQEIHLTPNEYRLLMILIQHAGRVLTHQDLLKEVWGPDSAQQVHYLRVYINQLRQKIEANPSQPAFLLTEPGVGYRFAEGQ